MIIDRISRETGVSATALEAIIRSASRRYKTYSIRKRTGGFREINHPAPALKFLQRWIVRNLIIHLPVHPSVMSYRSGIGISKNAEMHVAKNFLLKMDFLDFFPSIKSDDVRQLFSDNMQNKPFSDLTEQDVNYAVEIICRDGQLTIGAPSSPNVSNAVLYKFDEFVSTECAKQNVSYTRYADDISCSSDEPYVLYEIHRAIEKYVREQQSPRLRINDDKTIFTSKKRKRSVTGLILTSEEKVSIGRDKKRKIKSLCYRFKKGELSVEDISYLRGYLSFVNSVEPHFIGSLRKKYGDDIMQKILETTLVRRK